MKSNLMPELYSVTVDKQRGVALLQALLLTALLSLMAMQFTLNGRSQVNMATQFDDKIAAELALRTLETELQFALLTVPNNEESRDIQLQNKMGKVWNFHNKPFQPDEQSTVALQDLNGLISVYGQNNNTQIEQLLRHLGMPANQARTVLASINYWQGLPDNGFSPMTSVKVRGNYLQSVQELQNIQGIDAALYSKMLPLITNYQTIFFNPLTAPDELLQMMLSKDIAAEVIKLRTAGTLNRYRFTELTGIDEDDVTLFAPGRRIQVQLQVSHGSAVAKRSTIWYIRPENRFPLLWLQ